MRRTLVWSLGLVLSAHDLPAQTLPPDSLFDRLVGRWVLRGTIARQQTTHDVTFEWMLGRSYVQMHEVSRERAPNGSPAYEAVVTFARDPRTGEYACLWMDNTGASAFVLLPLYRDHQLSHHVCIQPRRRLLAMAYGQRQRRCAAAFRSSDADPSLARLRRAETDCHLALRDNDRARDFCD